MLSFDLEEEEEADEDESDSGEEKTIIKKEASNAVSTKKKRFGKSKRAKNSVYMWYTYQKVLAIAAREAVLAGTSEIMSFTNCTRSSCLLSGMKW